MHELLEIFRDLPGFLDGFIADHGVWVYGLLFAIIFAETGLVVTPFLPGDSLLFTVGALAARGSMNVWAIAGLLILAGVLGLIFGAMVLAFPRAGALAVVLWIGAYAFFFGILQVALALRLKRWTKEEPPHEAEMRKAA